MIVEARLGGVASYAPAPVTIEGLKTVNFFYGANGSGKTTISQLIADPDAHPTCQITWRNGLPLDRVVYNRHFVERTYRAQLPGIFTLGSASAEAIDAIRALKDEIDGLDRDIHSRDRNLNGDGENKGKLTERREHQDSFVQSCWSLKGKYDLQFQEAFRGVRAARAAFADRLLQEADNQEAVGEPQSLEVLAERAATAFAEGAQPLARLAEPSTEDLVRAEREPILSKRIIGKSDVDIAALIMRLQNSDWVRAGKEYLEQLDDQCPFCQQKAPTTLKNSLEEFFDDTYIADIQSVRALLDRYNEHSVKLLRGLATAASLVEAYPELAGLEATIDSLDKRLELNRAAIERKVVEPSLVLALEPIGPTSDEILALLRKANERIDKHNETLENLAAARVALTKDVWRFVVEEAKPFLTPYQTHIKTLNATITGLEQSREQKTQAKSEKLRELHQQEGRLTSVQPTVTRINDTLSAFGFRNFKLAVAPEDERAYTVIRADGQAAHSTLSEGEKTFITFLYFYHLVRGSTSESGVLQNRIVVYDDPISSLDSDVLFVVSSLIKNTIKEALVGTGSIRQVWVLTHNVFFHREVSFDADRRAQAGDAKRGFWVVRKRNEITDVQRYDRNPIISSYELLWAEVRTPGADSCTVQNALRRILEHYFKLLGNTDFDRILDKFEGDEKVMCAALLSWAHSGSHFTADDLHVVETAEATTKYLEVFKAIFVRMEHQAHYDMMIAER